MQKTIPTSKHDNLYAFKVSYPISQHEKKKGFLLTNIKLEALLSERVATSTGPIVLLQDQDFLSNFGQQHSKSKATNTAANDDSIQVLRYFTGQET